MTIATMADRSLPLADSVHDVIVAAMKAHRWTPSDEDAFWATADELLADIAAADRLARATVAVADAAEQVASPNRTDRVRVHVEWNAAKTTGDDALADYRARMAQGVARG